MRRIPGTGLPGRQRGLAMLVLLALFAITAAYMLVSSLNKGSVALNLARVDRNRAVMQKAKAALIAWAASETSQPASGQGFQPGALPCPDVNNDGSSDYSGATSCSALLGRLPYKTLGIDDLRDASGERLWYAVSGNFIRSTSNVINSSSQGALTLTGLAPANNVVAVVLAPGARLGNQDRSPGGTNCNSSGQACNTASNYLEGSNGIANSTSFVSNTENLTDSTVANLFNDQLLAITSQDLFSVVEPVVAARIERDVKPDILAYFSKWTPNAFPYPVIFAPTSAGPGTNSSAGAPSTRSQDQYIGDVSTASSGGLLPISAAVPYVWQSGTVSLTGGTAGSIAGTSCVSTVSPFPGLQCSFSITAVDLGPLSWNWGACNGKEYCIINPSISVIGNVANAGLGFSTPPDAGDVTVRSSVYGTTRTMTSTSIARTLSATASGTITYHGTHAYSANSTSWFSRTMVVTIPNLVASPLTSSADPNAGWFIRNEWYRLTYFAVSPGYLPGATAGCTALPGTPSCLTVNNLPSYYASPGTDKLALLILAGAPLNGNPRPSAALTDYLEGQNATPSNHIFEHGLGRVTGTGAAINDKVIVLAP